MFGLIQATHCFDSSEDGVVSKRLKYQSDILCDSDSFKDLTNFAVVPGLVVWMGILPVFALIMLLWNFNRIYYGKESIKLQKSRVRNTKYYFGFFIVGLKNGLTNMMVSEKLKLKPLPKTDHKCYLAYKKLGKLFAAMLGPISGRGIQIYQQADDSTSVARMFHYWEFYVYLIKVLLTVTMALFSDDKREL